MTVHCSGLAYGGHVEPVAGTSLGADEAVVWSLRVHRGVNVQVEPEADDEEEN